MSVSMTLETAKDVLRKAKEGATFINPNAVLHAHQVVAKWAARKAKKRTELGAGSHE